MGKVGKTAKDIFAATAKQETPQPSQDARGKGRPETIGKENRGNVTVVLRHDQVAFLDRFAVDVKEKTGTSISRAQIIRALIDGMMEGRPDPGAVSSEADLKQLVAAKLVSQ